MWGALVEDFGTLLTIEHVAMLPSMLLRREEYACATHARPAHVREVAA